MAKDIRIRSFEEADWRYVWDIVRPVFRTGETYALPPDITESAARSVWVALPAATFVAVDRHGTIQGTYYIKPNQQGPGDHVCNCGYIVDTRVRGRGIASAMCIHSQRKAIELGFRAMQYNLVVATNVGAVRLWKAHGFHVAGTLPGAFRHPTRGYVDAQVMFKTLTPFREEG